MNDDIDSLFSAARSGHRRSTARLLSLVERGGAPAEVIAATAHRNGGNSHIVGITGSPGAGKSTLTNALCTALATAERRVAVLAIDPSSPFTGGAILGDRIRMSDHALNPNVFVRSMATRGHLGGLSLATPSAVRLLDALGFSVVIVETVGVGQVEVDIVRSADSVVVVLNPGWGDAVQANKAGLMEIGDIFVINKADRAGAGQTRQDLEQSLAMRPPNDWIPPIVDTIATAGSGAGELRGEIERHARFLHASGLGERRFGDRCRSEIVAVMSAVLARRSEMLTVGSRFDEIAERVVARDLDPWAAGHLLLESGESE